MNRAALSVLLSVCACAARSADEAADASTVASESSTIDEQESSSTDEQESSSDANAPTEGDGDGDGDDDGDEPPDCVEPHKLDLPPDFDDAPMPDSCTVEMIEWPTPEQYPGCELCQLNHGCFSYAYLGCVTPAPGETCADICPSGDCLTDHWSSCVDEFWHDDFPTNTCGPYEIGGRCCTVGKFFAGCVE